MVETLLLAHVHASSFNVRPAGADEHIGLLTESIRQYGLLHPITVLRRADGEYEVVAGARRVQALLNLGHTDVVANVLTTIDDPVALSFAENIQRRNMLKRDVCHTVGTFLTQHNQNITTVAQYLHLHPNTVKRYALINTLDDATKARLDSQGEDHLTLAAAEKLAARRQQPGDALEAETDDAQDGDDKKQRKKGVKSEPWVYGEDHKPVAIPEPLHIKVFQLVSKWQNTAH